MYAESDVTSRLGSHDDLVTKIWTYIGKELSDTSEASTSLPLEDVLMAGGNFSTSCSLVPGLITPAFM